ncbi:hypothetical protein FDP41_001193 [Naegleria fowleri]|uniref:tRNAHis guanylyltransferase catalytic domain-containing protein n=1 Tax=Naegleria fowleri TaxID=5763 RepID=A0A6A5C2G2_NAEFO|nr:uncharacterized protein FDP41_001193 [Naegleria fowleri]KAF0980040.1 hypothetical protein FDP41_001193 [Naegleria fowleri]
MRFDGFHFKSFTSNADIFEKPFDANIHWAMMLAVRDFCTKGITLAPTLIYICSDEITMLFASKNEKSLSYPSLYNGRIQKLVSICTSFMTVGFNHYLRKLLANNYESFEKRIEYDSKHLKSHSKKILKPSDLELRRETRQKLLDGYIDGHFDGRVYQVPSISHAVEYILWRQHDCVRNSKTILGSKYFDQTKMDNLSAGEVVEMIEKKVGVRWADFPNEFKYGTFIKKIKHHKTGFNPLTKTSTSVLRTSPFNQCIKLMHCTPEFITNLVTQPLWSHNVLACNPMHAPEKVVLSYPSGANFTFGVQPYSFGIGNQAPVLYKDHLNSPFNENVSKYCGTTLAALSEMENI